MKYSYCNVYNILWDCSMVYKLFEFVKDIDFLLFFFKKIKIYKFV